MIELPVLINIADEQAVAILHRADNPVRLGVLVVVGGPQYRVGSHRQFLLLARALVAHGISTLRFDYRGMGDSSGTARDFEAVEVDLRAAVDELVARTAVEGVVIWGLCDAASAALMYAHSDPRIAGLILLNPWVHSQASEAKVRLKSYYLGRLRSREFWRKLLSFKLAWRDTFSSLWRYLCDAVARPAARVGEVADVHFIERMRRGWAAWRKPVLLILSGDDLTAAEFRQLLGSDDAWRSLAESPLVTSVTIAPANHTFARAEWRAEVESHSCRWIDALQAKLAKPGA
jgi:exosortase A-associated hydrolase 1